MFSFIKKSEFEVLEQVYSVKLDTMEIVMMTENIVNNVCRTSIKSPASREDKYIIRRTKSRCSLRGKTWRSTWCPLGTWSIKCVAPLSSQGHIETTNTSLGRPRMWSPGTPGRALRQSLGVEFLEFFLGVHCNVDLGILYSLPLLNV